MSSTPTKTYNPADQYKTPKKNESRKIRTRTPSLKAVENILSANSDDNSLDGKAVSPGTPVPAEDNVRVTRRRSTRKPSPTKKYQSSEFELINKSKRRSTRQKIIEISDETVDSEEEENNTANGLELDALLNAKPTETDIQLLEELNVAGRSIFGFNTPKKRDGMALAAMNTPKTPKAQKTPKTPKTPKVQAKTPDTKRKKINQMDAKTPSRVRRKVKYQIAKLVELNSDSDFSEDGSDFEPAADNSLSSSSESSLSDGNGHDDDTDGDANDEPKTPVKCRRPIIVPVLPKTPSAARLRQSARMKKSSTAEFVPESDGYFQSHSSAKILTSDHTLDRLKNPRLPADRLFNLLSNMKLSEEHEQSIAAITEEYKSYFPKWLYILNEGFNILLYGLGSKRNLLQCFHRDILKDQTVLVVNGFFPSLTIKDILDSITNEILDIGASPANPHEAVDIIEEEFGLIPETHLYLIVHNIDGGMLRNGKAQSILARLAKVPNIHLLASIDHINTPLLWDQTKLCHFNFSWWDCTSMLPYSDETAFENSLLVQNSGELALSSLRSVFSSLTTNSRGIYMLIVKYQLQNKGNPSYQGMLFKDLYWSCREAFLVSSDLALRAQLTEFLDHKLVKSKRSIDGSEQLTIPIESGLLQQFLEEQQQQPQAK